LKQEHYKRGETLPPLPFVDYSDLIFEEKRDLDEDFEKIKRSAKRSKWIGITCIVAGTVLFVARLMAIYSSRSVWRYCLAVSGS